MYIFVVNAYPERREKYDDSYTLFPAVLSKDVKDEDIAKYNFLHNTRDELKRNIVACSLSHKNVMKHIVENKLEKCIIIEDDAIVNMDELYKLDGCDSFTYIGGDLMPPTFTKQNKGWDYQSVKNIDGVNIINPTKFIIMGGHGYYLPTAEVAQTILDNIPFDNYEKAIDIEFKKLQKAEIIKHYIYPAISTLVVAEANMGFSARLNRKKYKFAEKRYYESSFICSS